MTVYYYKATDQNGKYVEGDISAPNYKGAVQKIDYGHGTVRPNLWGAKPPAKQKKRRK